MLKRANKLKNADDDTPGKQWAKLAIEAELYRRASICGYACSCPLAPT
jgi:hypothetical protein